MVHALRRAHEIVTPGGCVVDLHPTNRTATIEASEVTGEVDAGDAPLRHAAADAAIAAAIAAGMFAVERQQVFQFYSYADSIDELRHHVQSTWRDARIDEETVRRTREALRRAAPGTRPRVREEVRITRLRPSKL